jgi:hypothetical protein
MPACKIFAVEELDPAVVGLGGQGEREKKEQNKRDKSFH